MSGNSVTALLTIAFIAFLLLVADRYYRISAYLEGFQNSSGAGSRCGVDLPPCDFPLRCMNGICRSEAMPYLPPASLPVLP
jgi:hypothetical protein